MINRRFAALSFSLVVPLLFGYFLFTTLSSGAAVHAAPAVTLVVDTLADEDDGCAVGACSLRDAIGEADWGDTITFDVAGTIVLSPILGELTITRDLTIDGGGVITVSGNNAVRVFNVEIGNVTFDGLIIADGNVQSSDCGVLVAQCGGGIILQYSGVGVTVTNSTLTGNSANYAGGGIYNDYGTLVVTNSTLAGNSTSLSGGGIDNWGTLTVTNSTFSGNSAKYGGGIDHVGVELTIEKSTFAGNSANEGGGFYSEGLTVTVNSSTFSGNAASAIGGGIYSEFSAVGINNSTISGNMADYGGGVYNVGATMVIANSTVSDNRAGTSGGGVSSAGDSSTSTIISNTIVSGNVLSGTTTADDLVLYAGSTNSVSSGGYNLTGAIDPNITSINETGDMTNTLPQIGPLVDNGGDTWTHALLSSSPAVDSGLCSDGPATDQRGVVRPQDDSCDIGAFERVCEEAIVVLSSQSSGYGTLREAIVTVCEGGLITFDDGLSGSTIDISPDGQLEIGKSLTISGTVPVTVSGSNAVRVFNVTAGNVTFNSLTIAGGKVTGGDGGGINNSGGTVVINNSTLSGNMARSGGGFFDDGDNATVINNSTLSGNSASEVGGGIYNRGNLLRVRNSTLTDNRASVSGGGMATYGGNTAYTTIARSIVSGNFIIGSMAASDLSLTGGSANNYNSNGYNLIGTIDPDISFSGYRDQIGIDDPELAPLADNGGSTFTHALLPSSLAINAGGPCRVATDQRGIARPQGIACDSGAFEIEYHMLSAALAGTGSGSVTSVPEGIDCFDGTTADCEESYMEGTAVTLIATEDPTSSFAGWEGDCTGSGICDLPMTGAMHVTATFRHERYIYFMPWVVN